MVSILEAIRAQREAFIPKEVARVQMTAKTASQTATTSAQKAVNVEGKNFFDAIPKPSDLFLFKRDPRQEKANAEIGLTAQKQNAQKAPKITVSAVKTGTFKTNVAINKFLKGEASIASVFKSFGF